MRERKQERNTIVLPVLVNKKTIYTDFKEKKDLFGDFERQVLFQVTLQQKYFKRCDHLLIMSIRKVGGNTNRKVEVE